MTNKLGTASPATATNDSGKQEGTAIDHWGEVSPKLEDALGLYDKRESAPDKTRNPLVKTKASYQEQIEKILDTVLRVLEISGAAECRKEIKTLDQAITESQQRIAKCREQRLSALPEASIPIWERLWKPSCEGLEKSIAAEESKIADLRRRIGELKERFRSKLQQIGIEVFDDDIDSLLMPVTKDDFVSMAAVASNIATLTAQLERLTDESKEHPPQARRYYGMYLLLVYALDRIQTRFIQEVEHLHLPKLRGFEEAAREIINDAQNQIAAGGPKEQLRGNIDTARTTIEACHCFAGWLRDQKDAIARENEETRRMLDAAINTYQAVRLSLNVAEMMRDNAKAFSALRQVRLPRLRTFQNLQLRAEMQRLAERMREGKDR